MFSGLANERLTDYGGFENSHSHHTSQMTSHFYEPISEKIDLLKAVGLFGNIGNFSVRHHGVVLRPGPHSSAPAAFFTSEVARENVRKFRSVRLKIKSDQLLWSVLSKSELAVVASLKQWEGNAGTLLSLTLGPHK